MNKDLFQISYENDRNCAIPYFKSKYPGYKAPMIWEQSMTKGEDCHGIDFFSRDKYSCMLSLESKSFSPEKIIYYDSKYHISPIVTLVLKKWKLPCNLSDDYEIVTDIYFHVFKDYAFTISRRHAIQLAYENRMPIKEVIENEWKKHLVFFNASQIKAFKKELCFTDCSDFIDKYKDQLQGYDNFGEFGKSKNDNTI